MTRLKRTRGDLVAEKTDKYSGLLLFYDWESPLSKVPAEDFKKIILALFGFQARGEELPSPYGFEDDRSIMLAEFVFPQMERRRKASEAGKKGMQSRYSNIVNNDVNSSITSGADSGLVTIDLDKDKDKDKDDISPPIIPPQGDDTGDDPSVDDLFARFWKSYPRKVGKANAIKAFSKLKPTAELVDTMIAAIELQCKSDQWRRDNGQYIPHPTTWLNGRRWEDEISPSEIGGDGYDHSDEEWEEFARLAIQRGENLPTGGSNGI